MGSPERELCPPPSEEDELTLPRASINKMIKELVPSVRVAFESRELILNCCTEFIHLLSSEANEICNQSNKKTINAEHVLTALDRLGFNDYTLEAEAVLKDCKAVAAKRRRQSTRLENLGIPEEELLRQQQELFAKNYDDKVLNEPQAATIQKDILIVSPSTADNTSSSVQEREAVVIVKSAREEQAKQEQQQWLLLQQQGLLGTDGAQPYVPPPTVVKLEDEEDDDYS